MARDEREDHAVERAVGLLEEERGLLRREPPAACLDAVLATERLGLRDELIAADRARRVEVTEEQVAHADPALAEPAERVLVEARVPVLRGKIDPDALAKLRGDAVGSLAESGQRLAACLPRAGEHRVDRGPHEPPVPAGRREDVDLSGVSPPAQRVGVDAEDPARLPQRQPVAVLERRRGLRDTANLGESASNRSP